MEVFFMHNWRDKRYMMLKSFQLEANILLLPREIEAHR